MRVGMNTFHLTGGIGLNYKAQVQREGLIKSVMFLKEIDVRLIEVLADTIHVRPSYFSVKTQETLLSLKEKEGISYSVHFPMKYLDISSLSEDVRKLSIKWMQETVRFFEKLDVKTYVLHLTGSEVSFITSLSPRFISPEVRNALLEEMMLKAMESLTEIVQIVPSDKLCIENLNVPFKFYYQVVKKLNTSICMDVGHLIAEGEDPLSFFDRYHQRIRVIHLHDIVRTREGDGRILLVDHQALGTGILDLEQLINYLKQRKFKGYLILEFIMSEYMREKEALESWQLVNRLVQS